MRAGPVLLPINNQITQAALVPAGASPSSVVVLFILSTRYQQTSIAHRTIAPHIALRCPYSPNSPGSAMTAITTFG